MSSLVKQRIKLYNKNPYCFYCGVKMVLVNQSGGKLPPDACTIEHLISRLNDNRKKDNHSNELRHVLSCYKCNQERAILEELCMSRMEVLNRSYGLTKQK